MKNRKNLIFCIILVISVFLTGVIYASTVNENGDSKSTTSERVENNKKVETRLNTVWQDIKKTHNINEDQYIKLNIDVQQLKIRLAL